jgi:para-nitrobenzyl esterase
MFAKIGHLRGHGWRATTLWLVLGAAVVVAALQAVAVAAPHVGRHTTPRYGQAVPQAVGAPSAVTPQTFVTVKTTHGAVKGLKVTADGYPTYDTFFGIRYAQSAAPPNRWLPPKVANWTGTFDATQFGPCAEQSVINGYGDPDPTKMNEDSLRINIWTPNADNAKRPVLVYIHGGGYTLGRPDAPYYNGKRMAQKGIVYCDLSYRLGPFGFMNISDVPGAPAEYRASGNLGLLDQRMALKFVHDNIARFGGDPDRVTVAGGSAGAWSTTIHMALPESNRYFQRAIAVSGSPQVGTKDWSTKVCQMTMAAAGVTTFDQLMALTPEQLNDAEDVIYQQYDPNWWCILYRPSIDGVVIKQDPKKSIRQGQGKDIALLTEASKDELTDWMSWANWFPSHPSWGFGTNVATIPAVCADVAAHPQLTETWPADASGNNVWAFVYERMVANAVAESGKTPEQVEASYMTSYPGCTPNQAFFYMLSDLTFRIPSIRMAENRQAAPGHKNNTWVAMETWDSQRYMAVEPYAKFDPLGFPCGAYHEVGLGFALGIPEEWGSAKFYESGPYEAGHQGEAGYGAYYELKVWPSQLVPQHQKTWLAFIKTGNPNNPNIPKWAPYNTTTRETLSFDAVPSVSSDWHPTDRLLWESVPGDPLYDCPTDTAIPLP